MSEKKNKLNTSYDITNKQSHTAKMAIYNSIKLVCGTKF